MQDTPYYLIIASAGLLAIAILSATVLRGWHEWITYKKMELREHHAARSPGEDYDTSATSRIEMADLKERLKKLEAIAAGVEL